MSETPNEVQDDSPQLEEDVLKNMSLDALKALMQKTKQRIKQESKPSSEISPEILEKIKPYEDDFNRVQEDFIEFKKTMNEKLKTARETHKMKLAAAKKERDDAKAKLNEKRKEYNLSSTRASSAGPQVSWHVDVDIDEDVAQIGVKDKPETFVTIPIENGRAKIEDVREKLIKAQNISDDGGGRGRGVLNRISAQYNSKVEIAQNGGTVSKDSKPEDNSDESGNEDSEDNNDQDNED